MKLEKDDLTEKNVQLSNRAVKYREKVKFSIDLVQKLNNMLEYVCRRRQASNKAVQTSGMEKTP